MTTVQDALDEYLMTIGGSTTGAASGRTYDSVDPYTGKPWARVPDAGPEDVDAAVAAARAALDGPWGQLTAGVPHEVRAARATRTGDTEGA